MAGSASKSAGVSADGDEKVAIGAAARLEVARAIRRRRSGWVNGKEVFEVVVSLELAGAVW